MKHSNHIINITQETFTVTDDGYLCQNCFEVVK